MTPASSTVLVTERAENPRVVRRETMLVLLFTRHSRSNFAIEPFDGLDERIALTHRLRAFVCVCDRNGVS
jgi:hypothetical protein